MTNVCCVFVAAYFLRHLLRLKRTEREREREREQMTEKERQKGVNTIVKLTDNTHIGTIKYSGILTLCWRHKQKLITEKER